MIHVQSKIDIYALDHERISAHTETALAVESVWGPSSGPGQRCRLIVMVNGDAKTTIEVNARDLAFAIQNATNT